MGEIVQPSADRISVTGMFIAPVGYVGPPNDYFGILNSLNDYITDDGGTSILAFPLAANDFIPAGSYGNNSIFQLHVTLWFQNFVAFPNPNRLFFRLHDAIDPEGTDYLQIEIGMARLPDGDFPEAWNGVDPITFDRTFTTVVGNPNFFSGNFSVQYVSENPAEIESRIHTITVEFANGLEVTGEGGVEVNSSYVTPDIIGEGGVEIAGAAIMVLSADASGIYQFISGQHFDTIYTRNVNPDDTADIAMPPPFGKTGFFNG